MPPTQSFVVRPPETLSTCPVINEASLETRKATASAISLGSAILPSGIWLAILPRIFSPSQRGGPQIVADVHDTIVKLADSDLAILLVEPNIKFTGSIVDYHYILEKGVDPV